MYSLEFFGHLVFEEIFEPVSVLVVDQTVVENTTILMEPQTQQIFQILQQKYWKTLHCLNIISEPNVSDIHVIYSKFYKIWFNLMVSSQDWHSFEENSIMVVKLAICFWTIWRNTELEWKILIYWSAKHGKYKRFTNKLVRRKGPSWPKILTVILEESHMSIPWKTLERSLRLKV